MPRASNRNRIILDLCGGTGAWSAPYRRAGYDVRIITLPDHDVRTYVPPPDVYGVLAAPPCTDFSVSGARWWKAKGHATLLDALAVTDACLRIIAVSKPKFWALENPIGRLSRFIGRPALYFDPCDFGDPYTKRSCLWGVFNYPPLDPVEPTEGSKLHRIPPGPKRAELRSITPPGFAKAFFKANP